jgi:hypothetical protein
MEIKQEAFKRLPPGDRWIEIAGDGTQIFPTLTAALEHMFHKNGCKQYYVDAGDGVIYMVRHEEAVEPDIPTFSIYGDY